ncbi:tetratricopeptide repeat protein [Candidatus Berkelbacteria bacterium]|nr:tetratricopeptide repeat protein [Candidatus Berkelbacteria bacterium]
MHHLDQRTLLKIVVIVATAVVVMYYAVFSVSTLEEQSTTATVSPSTLLAEGNHEQAIKLYKERIAQLDEIRVETSVGLANAYVENDQLADAEAMYRKVIQIDAETKDAYIGLARLMIDQGRFNEATEIARAGLVELPDDIDLLKLEDDIIQTKE